MLSRRLSRRPLQSGTGSSGAVLFPAVRAVSLVRDPPKHLGQKVGRQGGLRSSFPRHGGGDEAPPCPSPRRVPPQEGADCVCAQRSPVRAALPPSLPRPSQQHVAALAVGRACLRRPWRGLLCALTQDTQGWGQARRLAGPAGCLRLRSGRTDTI